MLEDLSNKVRPLISVLGERKEKKNSKAYLLWFSGCGETESQNTTNPHVSLFMGRGMKGRGHDGTPAKGKRRRERVGGACFKRLFAHVCRTLCCHEKHDIAKQRMT